MTGRRRGFVPHRLRADTGSEAKDRKRENAAPDYRPNHRDAQLRPASGNERIGVGSHGVHNGYRLPFVKIVSLSRPRTVLLKRCGTQTFVFYHAISRFARLRQTLAKPIFHPTRFCTYASSSAIGTRSCAIVSRSRTVTVSKSSVPPSPDKPASPVFRL